MPFRSGGKFFKCKYCDNPAKVNYYGIKRRHKGYLRTCGNKDCLKRQYSDLSVKQKKAFATKNIKINCEHCNKEFVKEASLQKWCKKCVPDSKARIIMQRYGITIKKWQQMFLEQNGKCKLCDEEAKVVDHNHKTGEVRSLLCYGCNLLVGLLERDKDWIQRAMRYVE